MKSKLILFYAITLCACNTNPPSVPSNSSSGGSSNVYKPQADFSCKVVQPLSVEITNEYIESGVTYTWDFGDYQSEKGASPSKHRYRTKGVYKITLTAKNSAGSTIVSKNVTVENPTRCYVSGYKIINIPTNNMYYRCRFTDDYSVYPDNFATTSWKLLSSANLPYTFIFETPQEVSKYGSNKGYLLWLEKNNNKSGEGSLVKKWTATKAQIWQNFSESLTGSDNGNNMVTVFFLWK